MSHILNLESSTGVCSVALSREGRMIDLIEDANGRNHSQLMGVFVQEIMKRNGLTFRELSAVSVSKGPGSYTGLRIGVSLAKGLCYVHRLPLLAVSPLNAMADHVNTDGRFVLPEQALLCPMIDAGRMEVYMAVYNRQLEEIAQVSATVVTTHTFDELAGQQPVVLFGNGSEKLTGILTHSNIIFIPGIKTSAQFMCSLSEKAFDENRAEDLAYFEPFYLKDFIAGKCHKSSV